MVTGMVKCPDCGKLCRPVWNSENGLWYDETAGNWRTLAGTLCTPDLRGVQRYLPRSVIYRSFWLAHNPQECDPIDWEDLFPEFF